jgi:hypothetical protein
VPVTQVCWRISSISNACLYALIVVDHVQQRKRAYLRLLPPDQIIDLCLTFEQYAPLPIKTKAWPLDLEVEICKLQERTVETESASPRIAESSGPIAHSPKLALSGLISEHVHPPGTPPLPSLSVQPSDASHPPSSGDGHVHESQQADSTKNESTTVTANPSSQAHSSSEEQTDDVSKLPGSTSLTQASSSLTAEKNAAIQGPPTTAASSSTQNASPIPYPYAAYGYPLPPGYPQPAAQAAYPHTPYYSTAAAVPGYPPHFAGYAHYPAPPGYPTHQPPPPPPPVSGEDLPSYEDMIVEALMDIGEPDGAAPKDLFLWMGARWPLQTNFRPSASQALQKAFRRGRLEKRPGGKYRLNPNWEGGAVSFILLVRGNNTNEDISS